LRLITSAFPRLQRLDENDVDVGPDLVARCIRSWQDNGFDIVSIHNRAEEEAIGDGLPGVLYRFVDEALPEGTRTTPTLAAVLADLPPDAPVGIINADVFMVPFPGLAARMSAAAREATLLMHRWDVPSLRRREGRRFDVGVDLIAFTPRRIAPALSALASRPYQLGVPWWDYALPLAASLHAPLTLVADTLLLHHWHKLTWSEPEWHVLAEITEAFLLEQAADPQAEPLLAAEFSRRLQQLGIDYEDAPDRHARNYALDDLARHLIHQISGARSISLLAEMRLLPPPGAPERPWEILSEQEMQRAALRQAAEGAAAEALHAIEEEPIASEETAYRFVEEPILAEPDALGEDGGSSPDQAVYGNGLPDPEMLPDEPAVPDAIIASEDRPITNQEPTLLPDVVAEAVKGAMPPDADDHAPLVAPEPVAMAAASRLSMIPVDSGVGVILGAAAYDSLAALKTAARLIGRRWRDRS